MLTSAKWATYEFDQINRLRKVAMAQQQLQYFADLRTTKRKGCLYGIGPGLRTVSLAVMLSTKFDFEINETMCIV